MVSGVWGIVGRDYSCRSMAIINDPCSEHTEEWNSWRVCLGWTGWTFWTSSIPNSNGKSSCSPLRPFGGGVVPIGPVQPLLDQGAPSSQYSVNSSSIAAKTFFSTFASTWSVQTCLQHAKGSPNYSSNHTVYTCLHHYYFFFCLGVCRYWTIFLYVQWVFKLNTGFW